MDKRPLIVVSLCAVVILVVASFGNVVGYQTVQTSQQNLIKERINQRELLFQTLVDIANNKEIQRIILKSQMSKGIFPTLEFPVVTKNQLKMMYFLGLILSKVISKSRIQLLIGKYQFDNQEMQKEISTIIEKDATLNAEITQLQNSECDCEKSIDEEKESIIDSTDYPMICEFLLDVYFVSTRVFNLPFNGILLWLTMFPLMLSMVMISIMVSITVLTLFVIFDCFPGPPKEAFYLD